MERREDGAAREVMNKAVSERSTISQSGMVADPARGLHGGLKILPHGLLKTWGELCGARVKRRCGVMTAAPAETGMSPSPGVRGKCGE